MHLGNEPDVSNLDLSDGSSSAGGPPSGAHVWNLEALSQWSDPRFENCQITQAVSQGTDTSRPS
eukprot:4629968-Prymnesium_polylepis.1